MSLLKQAMEANGKGSGGKMRDVLVEVNQVDAKEGKMLVTEQTDDGAREYAVAINQRSDSKKEVMDAVEFQGNIIDDRMAEVFQPGQKVILEGMIDNGANSHDAKPMATNWINSAPLEEDRLRFGLFTAQSVYSREHEKQVMSNISQWSEQAIPVQDALESEELTAGFDRGLQHHEENKEAREQGLSKKQLPHRVEPNAGFALRVVNNQDEVVEFTNPIAYNREEKRPISSGDFKETLAAYEEIQKEKNPGCHVEVVPLKSYPATSYLESQGQMLRSTATNRRQRGKMEKGGEFPTYPNQIGATQGIIKLATGKINTRTGQKEDPAGDIVVSAFMSGRTTPVHESVMTANGVYPTMAEHLEITSKSAFAPREEQNQEQSGDQEQSADAPENKESEAPAKEAPAEKESEAPAKEAPAEQKTESKSNSMADLDDDDEDDDLESAFESLNKMQSSEPKM